MQNPSPPLDAPIPGMGMTSELGGRPWEQPSQYTTVQETVDYYIARMSTTEFKEQLFNILEMNVPVTSIVNTIQLSSVMDGIHTVDVGVIVSPILMEFIMLLADSANINYVSGIEEDTKEPSKAAITRAINAFRAEQDKQDDAEDVKSIDEPPVVEEVSAGLMARRS